MRGTPRQSMADLARRIAAARERGDFRAVELLTFQWHRAHEADLSTAGLSARLRQRTRDHAADLARIPLGERFTPAP